MAVELPLRIHSEAEFHIPDIAVQLVMCHDFVKTTAFGTALNMDVTQAGDGIRHVDTVALQVFGNETHGLCRQCHIVYVDRPVRCFLTKLAHAAANVDANVARV